ncbi:tetratricopeptide repeat protein [bacterium]|nr:tetratricopeptide repeat protein [bacterium]
MKLKKHITKALIILFTISSAAFASNVTLQGAIQKYKAGNYTGCIQDLETYTRNEQSNALAYYYLAIANVQAGRKENAIQAYDRVLALRPNETLLDYATKGKVCLEEPQFCYKSNTMKEEDTELDKFIKDKTQFVYKDAQKEETRKNLDSLKNRINSDEEINRTEFEEYERSSNKGSNNTKQAKMPTNDEVVAAIKVLNQAGLGSIITQQPAQQPIAQQPQQTEQQKQLLQAMAAMQQNPYGDISAMFGNNNNNNSSSNQFMNMLPFIMAQNGQNGQNTMSPEVMQAMMMNAMMPDLNFNLNNNNN